MIKGAMDIRAKESIVPGYQGKMSKLIFRAKVLIDYECKMGCQAKRFSFNIHPLHGLNNAVDPSTTSVTLQLFSTYLECICYMDISFI